MRFKPSFWGNNEINFLPPNITQNKHDTHAQARHPQQATTIPSWSNTTIQEITPTIFHRSF